MKHIIKKLALLFVPVYLWFAFFVAFEPNNYFGIKKNSLFQPAGGPCARL
ncbi:MAG: hypothetical protein ACLTZH_13510 [Subdoligranulum sp.]